MLAILGGGIAGLTAAAEAERCGISYQLFEAENTLGGNARTFQWNGFRYDAGAHRLHDRIPTVTARVKEWLGPDLHPVTAPSRIQYGSRFVDFPLRPGNLLRQMSPAAGARALASFAAAKLRRGVEPRNFQELSHQRFGRAIAEPFLIRYSEKLWGVPAHELSTEVSGRRLHGLSLRGMLTGRRGANALEGTFLYPAGGIGDIADALVQRCEPSRLRTGKRITSIEHDGRRIHTIKVGGGSPIPVTRVISTLPLALQTQLSAPHTDPAALTAASELRYRHVVLVALFLDRPKVSPYASTYYPDAQVPFTRVHEPRTRSAAMSPEGKTSLVAELVRFGDDVDWKRADDDLAREVIESLVSTGAIQSSDVIGHEVQRLGSAYPVLTTDAIAQVEVLRRTQEKLLNLDLVGRAATFQYLHIHDLMDSAQRCVQSLARLEGPSPRSEGAVG